jgi:hypothetical protein
MNAARPSRNQKDLQHREGVKKPDVEIGPISRRPTRGSDDHPQAKTELAEDPDGRRENASAQGPSTSLRISPAGSRSAKRLAHTRKTAQLYKKGGSFRNSARRLDYTGVMCLRITLLIAFQSASFR